MWILLISLMACGAPADKDSAEADSLMLETAMVGTWWEVIEWPDGAPYPTAFPFCLDDELCTNCIRLTESGRAHFASSYNDTGAQVYSGIWSLDYSTGDAEHYLVNHSAWVVYPQDADGFRSVETGNLDEDGEWLTEIREITLAEGCPIEVSGIAW